MVKAPQICAQRNPSGISSGFVQRPFESIGMPLNQRRRSICPAHKLKDAALLNVQPVQFAAAGAKVRLSYASPRLVHGNSKEGLAMTTETGAASRVSTGSIFTSSKRMRFVCVGCTSEIVKVCSPAERNGSSTS